MNQQTAARIFAGGLKPFLLKHGWKIAAAAVAVGALLVLAGRIFVALSWIFQMLFGLAAAVFLGQIAWELRRIRKILEREQRELHNPLRSVNEALDRLRPRE